MRGAGFQARDRGNPGGKIAALIEKKRRLMDSVVKEEDPGLLISFTGDELIELMELTADTK
jgi:hypothetical protein